MTRAVEATIVEHIRDALDVPGAIEYREIDGEPQGFAFVCPCGCGEQSWLPINRADNGWAWDGNREHPTLSPSVLNTFGCRWHGFLRAGVWESC